MELYSAEGSYVKEKNKKNSDRNREVNKTKNVLINRSPHYIDTEVVIGDTVFDCHMLALVCYSKYFQRQKMTRYRIFLSEDHVPADIFPRIYEWIISESRTLQPLQQDGILRMYRAAKYLEILELEKQCWTLMIDPHWLSEASAFEMYLEARKYEEEELKIIIIQRVCKSFLVLVTSKNFLELTHSEICHLLSLNSIGVHNEVEVLFAGLCWLDYDWQHRERYVPNIMRCIRFTLIPRPQLIIMSKYSDGMGDGSWNRDGSRIVHYPVVQEVFQKCLTNSTQSLTERGDVALEEPRVWLKSDQKPKFLQLAPLFTQFLEYLKILKSSPKDYYTKFVILSDHICAEKSNQPDN